MRPSLKSIHPIYSFCVKYNFFFFDVQQLIFIHNHCNVFAVPGECDIIFLAPAADQKNWPDNVASNSRLDDDYTETQTQTHIQHPFCDIQCVWIEDMIKVLCLICICDWCVWRMFPYQQQPNCPCRRCVHADDFGRLCKHPFAHKRYL